jgi:hypothetical protein
MVTAKEGKVTIEIPTEICFKLEELVAISMLALVCGGFFLLVFASGKSSPSGGGASRAPAMRTYYKDAPESHRGCGVIGLALVFVAILWATAASGG